MREGQQRRDTRPWYDQAPPDRGRHRIPVPPERLAQISWLLIKPRGFPTPVLISTALDRRTRLSEQLEQVALSKIDTAVELLERDGWPGRTTAAWLTRDGLQPIQPPPAEGWVLRMQFDHIAFALAAD